MRRPLFVLIPFAVVMIVVVISVLVLPKRYESSTLILIESERVPDRFVEKMATETVRDRLSTIRQEILSRTRLERVVRDTDPYPGAGLSAAVEQMRGGISLLVRGNDAFSIAFVHTDPRKAMVVANRVAALFIEETVRDRERQVQEAYSFIETQLVESRDELARQEENLRLYKERNLGTLPEQMNANLATLQRLQLDQQATATALSAAEERRRLLLLEEARGGPVADARATDLGQLRGQLEALRLRYTDEHPDVLQLRGRISRLEKAIADNPPVASAAAVVPYSSQSQVARVDEEIAALKTRLADVERRINAFQARVERAPRTEQDLATLTRDYQEMKDNYLRLLNKKLEAQMASKLEERWRGDSFKILDPAHVPERPSFPRPLLMLGLGLLGGLFAGVGCAVAAEVLDPTVKNVEDLQQLGPYPVLATIPNVEIPRTPRHVA